jgi:hypothetical protein
VEDLHPGIQALLRGLLAGPLSDLGQIALERLRCGPDAGKDDAAADGGEYPDIPAWRWEPTTDDARLQVFLIENVISHWLADELRMAHEMPKLARRLKLKVVAFDGQSEAPVDHPDFPGNLAGRARVLALKAFGNAFGKTIWTIRGNIDQGSAIP